MVEYRFPRANVAKFCGKFQSIGSVLKSPKCPDLKIDLTCTCNCVDYCNSYIITVVFILLNFPVDIILHCSRYCLLRKKFPAQKKNHMA